MSDVVDERQGLHKVAVELERPRHGAADLGDFQRVGQPVTKVVRVTVREDLGLILQSPEGP